MSTAPDFGDDELSRRIYAEVIKEPEYADDPDLAAVVTELRVAHLDSAELDASLVHEPDLLDRPGYGGQGQKADRAVEDDEPECGG